MTDNLPSALFLAGIALCFLIAGMVKGVIGMGLPTVAMGMLGLAMPPAQAAALLVVPSLVTNLWQMIAGPRLMPLARRLFTMQLFACIGTFAGIRFMTGGSGALAGGLLGVVLVAYAAAGLLAVKFTVRPRAEPWLSPVIGLLTGLLAGATGVFVVPAVPYLGSLGFAKEELIQALGLSFTVSTIALGAALMGSGVFEPASLAGSSLLALAAALAGMFLGQYVRGRLAAEVFRRWFFAGLLLIGLYLTARWLRAALG